MSNRRKTTRRELLAAGAAMTGGAAFAAGASSGAEPSRSAVRAQPVAPCSKKSTSWSSAAVRRGSARRWEPRAGSQRPCSSRTTRSSAALAAWALGMPINQVRPDGKPRSAVHELVVRKLQAYGDQAVRFGKHELWCNVEYLKVAVLDALDEVGCRYLVHVRAADAIVENNRVVGAMVATKRGLMAIRAKAVVDCTGDADVAYYAGAETMIETTALMPMTLSLALTNVDAAKVRYADVRDGDPEGPQEVPADPLRLPGDQPGGAQPQLVHQPFGHRRHGTRSTPPIRSSAARPSATAAGRPCRWSRRSANRRIRSCSASNGSAADRRSACARPGA